MLPIGGVKEKALAARRSGEAPLIGRRDTNPNAMPVACQVPYSLPVSAQSHVHMGACYCALIPQCVLLPPDLLSCRCEAPGVPRGQPPRLGGAHRGASAAVSHPRLTTACPSGHPFTPAAAAPLHLLRRGLISSGMLACLACRKEATLSIAHAFLPPCLPPCLQHAPSLPSLPPCRMSRLGWIRTLWTVTSKSTALPSPSSRRSRQSS